MWNIPEIITDSNSAKMCDTSSSVESAYLSNMIDELKNDSTVDTTKMYTAGCSLGSAFSFYASKCLNQWYGKDITAFA